MKQTQQQGKSNLWALNWSREKLPVAREIQTFLNGSTIFLAPEKVNRLIPIASESRIRTFALSGSLYKQVGQQFVERKESTATMTSRGCKCARKAKSRKLGVPANETAFLIKEFVQAGQFENISFDCGGVGGYWSDIEGFPS